MAGAMTERKVLRKLVLRTLWHMIQEKVTGIVSLLPRMEPEVATEQAFLADVHHKVKEGLPIDRVAEAVDRYPVSFGLKEKLKKWAGALSEKEKQLETGNTIRLIQNGGPEPKRKEVSE